MKDEELIRQVVEAVVGKIVADTVPASPDGADPMMVPVNASNRHVHLSPEDAARLFGADYQFRHLKNLSQPGQFAEEETLIIAGPAGSISKVRILGPCRGKTQVEILASDQYSLGIKAPVRQSGDLRGASPLTLIGPKASVYAPECAIIAQRHIHLDPASADRMGLKDGQRVGVEVDGERPVTFRGVVVRVNAAYRPDMHLDNDEANACLPRGGQGRIIP